jgi:hypothetical protein
MSGSGQLRLLIDDVDWMDSRHTAMKHREHRWTTPDTASARAVWGVVVQFAQVAP